jgi:hypothetical protein
MSLLDPLHTPRTAEERVSEEESRLSEVSIETLRYMYGYGVAWEAWLRHHLGNLCFLADDEFDLVEAMHLSSRLKRVRKNMARTGRRNEIIRSHLIGRELDE